MMKRQTIPNDGQWHKVPGKGVSAPTSPTLQLDIDLATGEPTIRNTGERPVVVEYA